MRIRLTAYSLLLTMCIIFSGAAYAQESSESVTYTSPEGIQFISYSEVWNEPKLKELYAALLQCEHGEELSVLKKVILYSEKSIGKSGSRVGSYNVETQTIKLYEVESTPVIRTLIHEYGHHFTYYWLQKKEGTYPGQLTESSSWAKIRQLDGFPIRWSGSLLPYVHRWDPGEIMAEDYVLLFGVGVEPMPSRVPNIVNLLRHENEYIPSAESIPALRQYWEKLAGFPSKESIKLPLLQQWSATKDGEPGTNRLVFSSSATRDDQLIQYGIQVSGYNLKDGLPMNWTTAVNATGKSPVEVKLDLRSLQEQQPFVDGSIQIWALDPASKQLIYTPFYMNWFSFERISKSLRAIPPPFMSKALTETMDKEGMQSWPLLLVMMNGMPLAPMQRFEDKEKNVYVPLSLFNEITGVASKEHKILDNDEGRRIKIKYKQYTVQLQMDEQLATVNGTQIKLSQRIRRMGTEPMVAVDDLKALFGATLKWDEAGNSLSIEAL
ncbi:copper amine oxidase N-terminal domain-containing protein [Paenibacillus agricola]|uniref:Copper amine oxidase N-terminal domain-containing protein n=1 Tax=Paenibacillus agricola TaxID=2716264 RepID=A0ABX0IX82_9BACL|nr:copper amine oxidase N-terminal domain-containing protein [Paenibacillus agricola]NHN28535.1 copper amine oxidase N-terminal domain-containing protein [Paenibacillus agricola]